MAASEDSSDSEASGGASWLGRRTKFAPFGAYRGNPADSPGSGARLVGREGQRAYLLGLLSQARSQCAILITGHRGAGKSSFVRAVLTDYERDVFGRFLRRGIGRAYFWDKVLLTSFAVAAVLGALLAHETLAIAIEMVEAHEPGQWPTPTWLLVFPLAVFVFTPAFYARKMIDTAIGGSPRKRVFTLVLWATLAAGAWAALPLGSAAYGMSTVMAASTVLILALRVHNTNWVWAESARDASDPAGTMPEREKLDAPGSWFPILLSLLIAASLARDLPTWWVETRTSVPELQSVSAQYRSWLGLALAASGMAALIDARTFRQRIRAAEAARARAVRPRPARDLASETADPRRIDVLGRGDWAVLLLGILGGLASMAAATMLGPLGTIGSWVTMLAILGWTLGLVLQNTRSLRSRSSRSGDDKPSVAWERGTWQAIVGGGFIWFVLLFDQWQMSRPDGDLGVTVQPSILLVGVGLLVGLVEAGTGAIRAKYQQRRALGETRDGSSQPYLVPIHRPRARTLLLIKAFVAITISVQLAHPLIRHVQDTVVSVVGLEVPLASDAEKNRPVPCSPGRPGCRKDRIIADKLRPSTALAAVPTPHAQGPHTARAGLFPAEGAKGDRDDFSEEVRWAFAFMLLIMILYRTEYEWIVRPHARTRQDRAIDPSITARDTDGSSTDTGDTRRERGRPSPLEQTRKREQHRQLAESTIFFWVFSRWIPLSVVSVNLGFEDLTHAHVVRAMLKGVRDSYHEQFMGWTSGLANVRRATRTLVLLALTTIAARSLFEQSTADDHRSLIVELSEAPCPTDPAQGIGTEPRLCRLVPSPWVANLLATDLLSGLTTDGRDTENARALPSRRDDMLVCAFLSCTSSGKHFRVYHVILLVLFSAVAWWLRRYAPLLPYEQNIRLADQAIKDMSSTRRSTMAGGLGPIAVTDSTPLLSASHSSESPPLDSRTIELVFLRILHEMEHPFAKFPGEPVHGISLPTPELVFVFDELDKLGSRFEPISGAKIAPNELAEAEETRRRSQKLHDLLADMKNLLSSSHARFFFVGGRDLHDEWLADQTARTPTLSSIFTAEVYLPSLLIDRPNPTYGAWQQGVEAFLEVHLEQARRAFDGYAADHILPSTALGARTPTPPRFVDPSPRKRVLSGRERREATRPRVDLLNVLDADNGEPVHAITAQIVNRDLVQFLAYRSVGNAKKLHGLVDSLVRPIGRVSDGRHGLWKHRATHALQFDDPTLYRIQLLANVYRALEREFAERIRQRDDKLVVSLFYLADFLFKFHGRGFNWTSLERVDELVHIHRAPDHREVLHKIVEAWSEALLHPILNGMYDFRFRSDFAREMAFVSRENEQEMAAFNFTLDESQALKANHQRNIQRMGPDVTWEAITSLGELYEFDQEYETARFHYRRALTLLDAQFRSQLRPREDEKDTEKSVPFHTLSFAVSGDEQSQRFLRTDAAWPVTRIRLMLQIGMTFERSHDYERALVEYRNARTLAFAVLDAFIRAPTPDDPRDPDDAGGVAAAGRAYARMHREQRLALASSLPILFQPAMAEAWVTEKSIGNLDVGSGVAERVLQQLRVHLPFVRSIDVGTPAGPEAAASMSSYSFIASELHDKMGDMYFFKGFAADRQTHAATASNQPGKGREGYLLRAHLHYVTSLHELRRVVFARTQLAESSWMRANGKKQGAWLDWPDMLFRTVGNTLTDVAECALGRVSIEQVLFRESAVRTSTASSRATSASVATVDRPSPASSNDQEADLYRSLRTVLGWLKDRARREDEGTHRPFHALIGRRRSAIAEWLESEDDGPPDDVPVPRFKVDEETPYPYADDTRPRPRTTPTDPGSAESGTSTATIESTAEAGRLEGLEEWLGTFERWPRPGSTGPGLETDGRSPTPPEDLGTPVRFGDKVHTSAERLLFYIDTSLAAARNMQSANHIEDAAREYHQVADTITRMMWSAEVFKYCETVQIGDGARFAPTYSDREVDLFEYTVSAGLYALGMATKLYQRARRTDHSEIAYVEEATARLDGSGDGHAVSQDLPPNPYLVGDKVPVALAVSWCSLALASDVRRLVSADLDATRVPPEHADSGKFEPHVDQGSGHRVRTMSATIVRNLVRLGMYPHDVAANVVSKNANRDAFGHTRMASDKVGEKLIGWGKDAICRDLRDDDSPPAFDRTPAGFHEDPRYQHAVGLRIWCRLLLTDLWTRHPYPVLARLRALKVWIDDAVVMGALSSPARVEGYAFQHPGMELGVGTLVDSAAMLERLATRYDSPAHFTDGELGTTLGLVWSQDALCAMGGTRTGDGKLPRSPNARDSYPLNRGALRHLNRIEGILTMQAPYYALISKMYYLYDDFNDRLMHANYASEMAAYDASEAMKKTCRSLMKRWRSHVDDKF